MSSSTPEAPAEPLPGAFPNPAVKYLAATRPMFLLAGVVPVFIGLATAAYSGVAIHWLPALWTLLGAAIAHAAVNVLNDYYDALNGTDAANTERLFPFTGGSRFIQNGVLSLAQTGCFGWGLVGATILIGLWLIWRAGPGLLWIGLAGLVIGWAYSAPPLKLNSRGLGEISVALGFGLLIPLGADYVQRGAFHGLPVVAGLSYGLLVTNLLYINQFPDRAADAAAGKHHWVVRLEPERARWGYVLFVVLAYGAVAGSAVAGWMPLWTLIALLPLPLSLAAARILLSHANQFPALVPAIRLTVLAALSHGLLLAAALTLVNS